MMPTALYNFSELENVFWNFNPAKFFNFHIFELCETNSCYTGSSKNMDGIWNRYNLKSTGRIYTFGVLKCSEKFKVLDLL